MAHEWTAAQSAAISTRDRSLLVSAAAGSGKTATLTARIISSLLDKESPTSLSRLLIVTFTNESAADMKAKIRRALDAAIEDNPENQALVAERLLLPSARICTIDSLCRRLLRRYAERLGLPAGFRVADTAEDALLSNAVMERYIEELYEGRIEELPPEDFIPLADTLLPTGGESGLAALMLSLYDKLQKSPAGIGFLTATAEAYQKEGELPFYQTSYGQAILSLARRRLSALLSRYEELLPRYPRDPAFPSTEKRFLYYLDEKNMIKALLSGLEGTLSPRELFPEGKKARIPNFEKAITEDFRAGDAPLFALHQEGAELLRKLKTKFFSYSRKEADKLLPALADFCRSLHLFLLHFEKRLQAEKLRLGVCSFADLETLAYRLLVENGEPSEVALSLRRELDAVYIDEFQDVNALQFEIFRALSPEGSLFMVGDIKQSIYSFRMADPSIFAGLRDSFPRLCPEEEQEASTVFFSENFRCDRPIVDFVNATLGMLFRRADGLLRYEDGDDLVFGKKEDCGSVPVTVRFFEKTIPQGEERENDFSFAGEDSLEEETAVIEESEAAYVAEEILRLLRVGRKNNGEPLRPSDIALLFRSQTSMAAFREAIGGRFKTVVKDTGDFFLNPEVLLALSLLNTVDNPHRDVYLAGALRSPIFGFTMEELIEIRRPLRDASLYDALLAYCEAHPDFWKGHRFLSLLDGWRLEAEGEPVGDLLLHIFRDCGLLYLSGEGSAHKHENLLLLYNYARTFEGAAYRGLYNFIGYINRVIEEKRTLLTSAEAASPDAVRMMTIHASKGLEFPVCFLCDAGHHFNRMDLRENLLYVREWGIATRLLCRDGGARAENPLRHLLAERMGEALTEEELRVLYVALTRARERLYITGSEKKLQEKLDLCKENFSRLTRDTVLAANSYLAWLITLPAVTSAPGFSLIDRGEAPEQPPQALAAPPFDAAATQEEEAAALYQKIRAQLAFAYPEEALLTLPEKLSVSRLSPAVLDAAEGEVTETLDLLLPGERSSEAEAPFRKTPPAFISGTEEDAAALAGTATHLFMQFTDLDRLAADGPRDELRRLTERQFLTEEEAARVRLAEIERFTASSLFKQMRAAHRLRRELRFHANLPAALFTEDETKKQALLGHTLLVQGVIDCVIEKEDGSYILIDYKTDRLSPFELSHRSAAEEKLRTRHTRQLTYYAAACQKMYGRPPSAVYIYSLPLGDSIPVPLSPLGE